MEELNLEELIAQIKDSDDKVRAAAWLSAGKYGAVAVKPLASVMTDEDVEIARAAKRALWVIVRWVGRPGAEDDKRAVEAALCGLLGSDEPDAVRCEVLWMLSEIGGDEAVAAVREIPGILYDKRLREDARCAVQRIPGDAALETLQGGFDAAPEDFRPAIAESLRDRGVEVDGYPSQKLVPTKKTDVQPVSQ
ncbi:MAG: hypothetical protein JXB62_17490 [Pirellulales bacterium]|nr:hypothetical protein [Pirellulales bacterium]